MQWRTALGGTAVAIASVIILGATIQPVKAQFTAAYGFGDSYADIGAAPGRAFRPAGALCIYQPNCTFTGSTTFVQSLSSTFVRADRNNFAVGGGIRAASWIAITLKLETTAWAFLVAILE